MEVGCLEQELAQAQSKPQATQDKQKIAEKTTALANTLERQEKWSEKGEYKRNLDNLTTIAGGDIGRAKRHTDCHDPCLTDFK
ncbi:hypothetical protein L5B97_01795 [Avibacterium sp. 20-15]|uniref:hypothetical protein n=1 Tax=unclassified Avibacterium TaxID=2685287 RepID=UPI0020266440|nr:MULTISPECIES: hypothetical protein [unclassified Avibacterium]MCW9732228.1 hypothetical protein [Avibacterium sp. 20-15]URL04399.1 hypothetical protein L4F93_00490 [Avibacterium sp. 20-132]